MTAEVAILNRSAVALAADSAMTIGLPGSKKIYPVNKVFTLSKFHPVGIMIYNNASYMGIPLETIIKMYRNKEWDTSRSRIISYAGNFLSYLGDPLFCTPTQISQNVERIIQSAFITVRKMTLEKGRDQFLKTGKVPNRQISRFLKDSIKLVRDDFEQAKDSSLAEKIAGRTIMSRHQKEFDNAVKSVFAGSIRVTKVNQASLRVLARLALVKDKYTSSHSGLVIAGFGQDDMFPTLVEIVIDGYIEGALKFKLKDFEDINRSGTHTNVMAFAQGEMVDRFMYGVDPLFEEYFQIYVQRTISKFTREIVKSHVPGTSQIKKGIMKGISTTIEDHMNELRINADKTKEKEFRQPILDVVQHLPIPELAHMAEALVNLTSIKRRVSAELESVGGPVDVAVISKGEGFVWIKRKHYFNTEINQDFMQRYLREAPKDDNEN